MSNDIQLKYYSEMDLRTINANVSFKQFAGGEWNVNVPFFNLPENKFVTITAHIHSGDVMQLAILVDAVRRMHNGVKIRLDIPYLPYARQDRVMTDGESLALKVFCDFINYLKFEEVTVDDCHSDVGIALLNNVRWFKQYPDIATGIDMTAYDAIVSPDAGAMKKATHIAVTARKDMIVATKNRNVQTGEVSNPYFSGDVVGKNLLIVDDLCDAGNTFIKLAIALKEKGAKRVDLYVTHGIFAYNAKENMKGKIDNVYAKYDWTKV